MRTLLGMTQLQKRLGVNELDALEKSIRTALASSNVRFALPATTALQLVETTRAALVEVGNAAWTHCGDADFIVDLSWRLKNMRRAVRAATKVRIPKRLANEPAVLRLRAIAKRALGWDDDAEAEMVVEFGYGLERVEPNDSIDDVDVRAPKVGHEFEDQFGSRYRVTGYDDEEGYVDVELVRPAASIHLETFLAYSQLTREQREARFKHREEADDGT